jgi:rhodanese-related sulfurtransferase
MEVPTVRAAELRSKIDAGDTFVLVDALAPMVYAHSHLPGAINIPPSAVDPDTIGRRIPDRTTEVVIP